MSAFIDLAGQRFGRWTVLERVGKRSGKLTWLCRCDCGKTKSVVGTTLTRGRSRSCGCFRIDDLKARKTTHGETNKTRLYSIWHNMLSRCRNPKNKNYKDYGGRGITVCPEWENSYVAFRDWAYANGYSDDLSIDRINNDKGYNPDNCRWATVTEQTNNRRNVKQITFNGETHTIREWSVLTGIAYEIIYGRLNAGLSADRALTEKPKKTTE